MTDYSNMSDLEINTAVVASQFGNWKADADICQRITSKRIDYCNNPSDAWPIIVENKISLDHLGKSIWGAKAFVPVGEPKPRYAEENPLRAAMICFLMMKDAEKC